MNNLGCFFGIHGCGTGIVLAVTKFGGDLFTLRPPLIAQPITQWTRDVIESESCVMLLSLAILLRLSMLSEMIVLSNARQKRPSIARVLNDLYLDTLTYFGLRFLPGGPVMFFVFTYCAFYTFSYGYFTLKSAMFSNDYAMQLQQQFRKIRIVLKFLWSLSLLCHFLYVLPVAGESSLFVVIAALEGIYSMALMASAFNDVRKLRSN